MKLIPAIIIAVYTLFVTIPSVPLDVAFSAEARHDYLMRQKPGYESIEFVNENYPDSRAYLIDLDGYRFYCNFEIGGTSWGGEAWREFYAVDDRREWLIERGYDLLLIERGYRDEHPILPDESRFELLRAGIIDIWRVKDLNQAK
jgi:hypothetical protein